MKLTILITGASGGIGKEFALVAAEKKNDVVLVARSESLLKNLCEQITTKYQVKANYLICDLSEYGSAEKLYKEVIKRGFKINYLINNAGFGDYGNFVERSLSKYQQMIHLNITSLTELTWLFAKDMVRETHGGILNIASTASVQPDPYMAIYGATKSFVANFTEALSYELKDTGVTATVLSPGATTTGFFSEAEMGGSKMMGSKMMTAEKVARIGYDAMMKGKLHVIAGFVNKMLGFFSAVMPSSRFKLRVAAAILGKKPNSD
ncbi:MAG: SDR family oxidoreductase [Bacteroidota bacterium]